MNPQEKQNTGLSSPALPLAGGAALLLLAALVIYWPALHGGLVLDDALWVNHDPNLKTFQGLTGLWRGTHLPDFFPLTSTLFWIEWHLWDGNLLGFHLT